MSIVLPQEVQTNKLKSLPEDLKSIADELIADKFGIEEEVVLKWGSPFPGHDGRHGHFTVEAADVFIDPSFHHRQRGYRHEIEIEIQPWDGARYFKLRIDELSFYSLVEANKRFDRENIRGRRELIVNPVQYNYLRMDRELCTSFAQYDRSNRIEGAKDIAGNIMGMDIIVTPNIEGMLLIAKS